MFHEIFGEYRPPRVKIKPPLDLGKYKTTYRVLGSIHLRALGQYEVVFFERHGEGGYILTIYRQVFGILEEQLIAASGLLGDIEAFYFQIPTCYPGREVNGRKYITKAAMVVVR